MRKIVLKSGDKFNFLTVVEETEKNPKSGQVQYLCLCDCGNETVQTSFNIRHRRVVSCGCYGKVQLGSANGGTQTTIKKIEICPECNGSKKLKEEVICSHCGGSGEMPFGPGSNWERKACLYCSGKGKKIIYTKCPTCNGTGKIE